MFLKKKKKKVSYFQLYAPYYAICHALNKPENFQLIPTLLIDAL